MGGYVTLPPQLPERLGPHCPFNHYLRNERSQQEFETFNVTRGRPSHFSEVGGQEATCPEDCASKGQESSREEGDGAQDAET